MWSMNALTLSAVAFVSSVLLVGCGSPSTQADGGVVDGGAVDGGAGADAGMPAESLVFSSDWSTATGSSAAAVRDTGSTTPWAEVTNPAQHAVIANASGLGFPASMQNALRVTYDGSSSAEVRCFDCWTAPQIGQSLYYRWYFRFDIPDSYGDLPIQPHHPFAARFGQCPFEWEFKFGPRADGSLEMSIPFYASSVIVEPAMPLQKSATYRVELAFHRQAATTYKVDVRLYDQAGALVFDDATLQVAGTPGQTLASLDPDITISQDTCLQSLQLGSNGPGSTWSTVTNSDAFLYLGGVAVGSAGWVGPHVTGEQADPP